MQADLGLFGFFSATFVVRVRLSRDVSRHDFSRDVSGHDLRFVSLYQGTTLVVP
jgi:hypothetical protein